MHSFGASAPIKDVMPHFGFTADHVYDAAKAQLDSEDTRHDQPARASSKPPARPSGSTISHRKILDDGELQRLIDEDGLKGLTSNPSIFEKAIGEGDAYDARLKALLKPRRRRRRGRSTSAWPSPTSRPPPTIFRPTYDRLKGADGYVSLEVSPQLAMDTEGTIAEARAAVGARWTGPT